MEKVNSFNNRSSATAWESEENARELWMLNEEDLQSRSESSASTWTIDAEYENNVGEEVGRMFQAIDCRLYEGTELPKSCKGLELECQCWIKAHPHLRVTGHQLDSVKDQDAEIISLKELDLSSSAVSEEEVWSEYELIPGLQVVGTSLQLNQPNREFSEELIQVDGTYEELIAFDNRDGLWTERNRDLLNESELELKIRNKLAIKIWQKMATKLLQNLVDRWLDIRLTNVSRTPNHRDIIQRSSNKLPECNQDLQSLLTISSKTLLNRVMRPPSVHTRTRNFNLSSTVSLQSGSAQGSSGTAGLPLPHSACSRRLAPIAVANHLFTDNSKQLNRSDHAQTLTKRFPALPPIEKVNFNNTQHPEKVLITSSGQITRTQSESKPVERISLRLNSGSRLPIHISKINLGSLSSWQFHPIIDYPRSANWAERASSGRNLSTDKQTGQRPNNESTRQLSSSAYKKAGQSDIEALLEITKPKFWI